MKRFFLVCTTLTVICGSASVSAEKPNILFIIADDLTWEGIGAAGGEVKTPHLDQLVESGVHFRHAYNMGSWTGAVCVASRTMLNTGLSLWEGNQLQSSVMNYPAKTTAPTAWSQLLSAAGYDTYFAGKWHVKAYQPEQVFDTVGTIRPGMPNQTPAGYNRPRDGTNQSWLPWDRKHNGFWKGGTHWSEVLRDEAILFLNNAQKKKSPFFMYISFNAPHDPRQAPKEYVDMYPVDSIQLPDNFLSQYPYCEEIESGRKLRDEKLAPYPRTEYAVKVNRAEYFALISHMDAQIGKILEVLQSSGKADNTYIFFTADHGLAVGRHGLMGKQNMYEHSLAAPLIVTGPGLAQGKRLDERIYIQDIVPSTLELAAAPRPEGMYFESFMPLLRGEQTKGREVIYGAYKNAQRCIIQGDWKLMYYPNAAKYRLYNLRKDPAERIDCAENPEYSSQLTSLKQALAQEMKRLNDPLR